MISFIVRISKSTVIRLFAKLIYHNQTLVQDWLTVVLDHGSLVTKLRSEHRHMVILILYCHVHCCCCSIRWQAVIRDENHEHVAIYELSVVRYDRDDFTGR